MPNHRWAMKNPEHGSEKILIVEDEQKLAMVLKSELERAGMEVTTAGAGEDALKILQESFDVMLLDLNLPGMSGMELFEAVRDEANVPEVVFITGDADLSNAVKAMKLGAYDYLKKPVPMERLEIILRKAAEKRRIRFQNVGLKSQFQREETVRQQPVVLSPATKKISSFAGKIAGAGETVLITGETGSGKDVLAKFIHQNSGKSGGPFIQINCAALQETILENELFGHEKGAFTGARSRKLGFFEISSDGTLFLDEIAEMGLGMQSKLLQVLENGSFYRVGGTRLITTDVRVITATNRDLDKSIREGGFRQDLFYRLNAFSIHLPPLRDRTEEIIPLAERFLAKRLSEESRKELLSYHWPGNVRELKQVIQRASIIADGVEIEPSDLYLKPLGQDAGSVDFKPLALESLESEHIARVLDSVNWNRSSAAEVLDIDPKTLYRKIKKYELEPEE